MKTMESWLMVAVAGLSAELLAGAVPEAYEKLWNASVNRGIDERIERYRKADAVVSGLPAGAVVKVEQAFRLLKSDQHVGL